MNCSWRVEEVEAAAEESVAEAFEWERAMGLFSAAGGDE